MNWTRHASGEFLRLLNSLHTEVVINAASTIATRPDITVSELRELLSVIEEEALNVDRFYAKTATNSRLEEK